MSVIKPKNVPGSNLFPSAMSSRFAQSSFDPYHLSSDNGEYITPKSAAAMTPRWSNRAAQLVTAARLYLNSPPDAPRNWGQVNPNLNDYHSEPMEIRSTFWLSDITDWWRRGWETHSKYTDLPNVAHDIFSIITHGVRVEASFSLVPDIIGCTQSKTTGETIQEEVLVRQMARANNGILAADYTGLDAMHTENDLELKREVEDRKLHRMAKVNNDLEMWQGSQNIHATQKEFQCQNKQMTAVEYISDTEEIIVASWSNFQHDGAAAFKCQKDHHCHQLCLQTTSLEDKLKYWMSSKSNESTVIQL